MALTQLKVNPGGLARIVSALDKASGYPLEGERVGGGVFVPFAEAMTLTTVRPVKEKEGDLYFSIDSEVLKSTTSDVLEVVVEETTREQKAWTEREKVSVLELSPAQLASIQKSTPRP